MATKTIGATGRDYATCALYASYLDGLNTLSAAEVGNFYNDGEFAVAGDVMVLTGFVPSASNTVTMQPATGQGFKDASGATTNPQKYDQSKGVGIKRTANYGWAITFGSIEYITFKGFQVRGDGGSAGAFQQLGANSTIDSCILEDYRGANTSVGLMINSLFVSFNNPLGAPLVLQFGGDITNSSVVRPSDVSGAGVDAIQISYAGGSTLLNVNVFGFANAVVVSNGSVSSTTCYTDDASPPSGFTTATYSSQFENTVAATRDFRTKSGATIIGAGTNSGAPTLDIVGQTRPNPPTVGHFELLSGGGDIELDADQGTVTVTGYAATTRFSVAAAQGVASVSGQAATTRVSMAAAQGAATVTGQASTVAFLTAAAQGALAVAGQAAAVTWGVAAAQGSVSVEGQAASVALVVAAADGAVAVTGYDATFDLPAIGNITMDADTGAVTIAGFPATVAWAVAADQGAISVSGEAAAVLWGFNVDAGELVIAGEAADFDGAEAAAASAGDAYGAATRPARRPRRRVYVAGVPFWSTDRAGIAEALAALRREIEAENAAAPPAKRRAVADLLDVDAFIAAQEEISTRDARARRLAQIAREEDDLAALLLELF